MHASPHCSPFLSALHKGAGDAITAVLQFALPPRCPACGIVMPDQYGFCPDCWGKLDFLSGPCCACCGVPFEVEPLAGEQNLCAPCMADPPPWQSARAVLAYDDIVRHIVMRFKYGRRIGLARLMARGMLPRISALLAREGEALFIPVPLHRRRLWERGFNQSALIARHLAKMTGQPVDLLTLQRVRSTRPLRAMNPAQRQKEVKGAFALDPKRVEQIRGKNVILIDDVHTSGATARACTEMLLAGGAASVHFLSWARALPGREAHPSTMGD